MAQFTIPKKLENEFRPSLTLGSVYMFVDVNTADIKNKKYIYHHQNYMLQFKSSTKVHHLESRGSSIPKYSFEFCPFDQMPSKSRLSKPLIDLIGVISHVGPYDYAGKTTSKKNRKLRIRNKDEQEQEIVLWGEYGEAFDEAFVLQKSTDHKIVVAIFAGLTAGTYLG
uniref:Replication protein A OB domain-containing protein n=1 Tax=Oryza meridionalis TaxID=40149 RepID=A0A0E0D553_9ORYZ